MNDCNATPIECELVIILDRFNENLNKLDEFSNIILDKTCKISNYREPTEKDCEEKKQREGYIGESDSRISRFIDYNNRLEKIVKGLTKIAG